MAEQNDTASCLNYNPWKDRDGGLDSPTIGNPLFDRSTFDNPFKPVSSPAFDPDPIIHSTPVNPAAGPFMTPKPEVSPILGPILKDIESHKSKPVINPSVLMSAGADASDSALDAFAKGKASSGADASLTDSSADVSTPNLGEDYSL